MNPVSRVAIDENFDEHLWLLFGSVEAMKKTRCKGLRALSSLARQSRPIVGPSGLGSKSAASFSVEKYWSETVWLSTFSYQSLLSGRGIQVPREGK